MSLKLSVIIPAYNESVNLKRGVLDQVHEYLKSQSYSYEVLIVDDGSIDDTVEVAEREIKNKKGFKVIKNPHGGKAVTVMNGLLKAQGEVALFTDMDQATPIKEVEKLFTKFDEGVDIVIGSRTGRKGAPLIRKLMAFGFATLRGVMLSLPFSDTQCGFKAFNTRSRQEIFPILLNRWNKNKTGGAAVNAGFDVETLFLAKKMGFKIAEVSVEWHHVGTKRVQMIKDSLDAVKDIIRIRLDSIRGIYDKHN